MVRIDKQLHEKIKVISEQTDFSVQYIVNLLLNKAVNAVVIEE
nr:MAG TPA: antitoxin [Caudoviricetes sp.]